MSVTRLKRHLVHMEEVNRMGLACMEEIQKVVELSEAEEEKLYLKLLVQLEEFFHYPDYRRHL